MAQPELTLVVIFDNGTSEVLELKADIEPVDQAKNRNQFFDHKKAIAFEVFETCGKCGGSGRLTSRQYKVSGVECKACKGERGKTLAKRDIEYPVDQPVIEVVETDQV
jgi:DnaJ-class molecular chaperone